MRKSAYIIISIVLLLLGVFFLIEAWSSLARHFELLSRWWENHKRSYYPWYLWVLLGSVIFPLMNRFLEKNIEITKTFTHEMSHAIMAILTFRRIQSLHVTEREGVVYSSGSEKTRFLVTLAPYCFLWYTFPLMALRCMVHPEYLPIMDIIIGFTLGLHAVCFKEQTGNHQTDINRFPLAFSYIYIFSVLLFSFCLLQLSYEPSLNIFYAFKTMGVDMWHYITLLWK